MLIFRGRSVLWLLLRFERDSLFLGDSKFSKKPCSRISFAGESSYSSLGSKLDTADDELLSLSFSLSSLFEEEEDEGVTLSLKTLSSSLSFCSFYLNELR